MEITTLGIDPAKPMFQLHGIDEDGLVVLQRKVRIAALLDALRRLKPYLIGMEACPTAHLWAREIAALGHEVRLIPPTYASQCGARTSGGVRDCHDAGTAQDHGADNPDS